MTQNSLGVAIQKQAETSDGPDRARLLGEAVAAYRAALEVRTRTDLPQAWAMTQCNLGLALKSQADACGGGERAQMLGKAAAAVRSAMEIYGEFFGPESVPPWRAWVAKAEGEISEGGQK